MERGGKSNAESLLIDMDGVMADTMGGMFDYVERHHGYNLTHEDIKSYWFGNFSDEEKHNILAAMRTKDFYRHLKVMTGVVRAVKRLREEYNGNVYVCSAPMAGAELCETEKRDWLSEHFDEEFAQQAIVTADKAKVPGRVIIEDNPGIGGGMWQPVIFNQPYNQEVTHPRMYGWYDLAPVRDNMRKQPIE